MATVRRLIYLKMGFSLVLFLCLGLPDGQAQYTETIEGYVKEVSDSNAIEGVAIQLIETGQWAISDENGFFSFSGLKNGYYTLLARLIGYNTLEFSVPTEMNSVSTLYLVPLSIELDEVRITAREATLGSVSHLEGYALKHTQPVSLADVLQLVPGQLAQNPFLGDPAQFTIRQAPVGSAAQRMNALGTALLMDGAPVSNNANLQINTNILNNSPGSLPPFSSVAGRGNDLRSIPADFIESVEVIRGIASAKYGDLSSGAVLIDTRLGAYRPKMLVRINPTIRQLSFGMGKKLDRRNTVNAEVDLTSALSDPRNDLEQYTRANLQLGWENRLEKFTLKNRITLFTTLDQTREAPESDMSRRRNYNRDRGFRLNSQGRWQYNQAWIDNLNYTFALSYQQQESFFQELVTRDIFPVTDAITDTTHVGEYGQSSYLNETTVDGRPLNAYLRLEAGKGIATSWLGRHRVVGGFEWRHDSNRGNGRQFDPKQPPRQNYSMGDRPRTYASIPALNQIGIYFSDRWSLPLNKRQLLIEWGFRADAMYRAAQTELASEEQEDQWYLLPAPRINTSLSLGKGWSARAGFGIMAKMPTLSYLYPNPVFYDLVNFNYFATNPAERLVILSTRKLTPNTSAIRPYQSRKWELGMDYRSETTDWNFSFAFFHEQMDDAIQVLRQIVPIENPKFEAQSFPQGAPPILSPDPIAVDTFMAAFDLPQNDLAITNRGLDFTLQTPQIKSLRTSFNLTGALLHTRSRQTVPFVDANRAVFSNQFEGKVPIFPSGQGQESIRMNTSLRLIHHIPALKLIISGLVQTVWVEQNRLFGYEETPEAYIGRDGLTVELTEQNTSAELLRQLERTINPQNLEWQKRPPLWLFNIRLTKEWDAQRGFSFYVNNVMNSRPLFTSNLSGFQVERNQPEFFFGAEVYFQF